MNIVLCLTIKFVELKKMTLIFRSYRGFDNDFDQNIDQ